MVNTNKLGIAKLVLCLWLLIASRCSQHNKVTMVIARIENILVVTDITSCVIYAKNFVLKYAAIFEQYLINCWLGSAARLQGTTDMHHRNAGKKMTFQLRNEVLENH